MPHADGTNGPNGAENTESTESTDGGARQIRWISRGERRVHSSRWLNVSVADVELPDGRVIEHHFVRAPGAAITAVVDDRRRVLMLYRHRFVADLWGWELPGGLVDDQEDPAVTAAREVAEETGYRVWGLERLVTFQPMAGMVDSPHHVFLAEKAELIGPPTEETEAQDMRWVPLAEAARLLHSGKVLTSGTAIGLLAVLRRFDGEAQFPERQAPDG